jgi:hypothetical protein
VDVLVVVTVRSTVVPGRVTVRTSTFGALSCRVAITAAALPASATAIAAAISPTGRRRRGEGVATGTAVDGTTHVEAASSSSARCSSPTNSAPVE